MQALPRTYLSIQYLRAIAAIMVIALHAGHPIEGPYPGYSAFDMGHAGVDIFFVISGFIMLKAAGNDTPGQFLRRRFVRIWPLYAIATLATYLFFARFDFAAVRPYDASDLIQSLAFIPHESPRAPGNIWPFLIPGWTLNYEMFFYVIFAIGIWANQRFRTVAGFVGILAFIGFMTKPTDPAFKTYTNPILLEFLAGMAIARWGDSLPKSGAWLLPLGVVCLFSADVDTGARVFWLGLPATIIVAGAVAIENNWRLPYIHWWKLLGDASYAIYLFQIISLTIATMLLWHLPFVGALQTIAMIILSVGGSIAAGILAHLFVEKPIGRRLSRKRNSSVHAPQSGKMVIKA